MAPEERDAINTLKKELADRPFEFDFFLAVRRLECAYPDRPRVGYARHSRDDIVQFGQNVSLDFAPSALHAYTESAGTPSGRMMVNFLGLLGVNGPMPLPLTEYVHSRIHHHADKTLARFLDIFNHRMLSLFYRAWACNQQTASFDRKNHDSFGRYFGSLFGMGTEAFLHRDAIPDDAKLYYCGRLSNQAKNAEGLQSILHDYFGLPVTIQEFVGEWIKLPEEYCCCLGKSPSNGTMGSTLIVGSRFVECQHKFRIVLGPMGFSDFQTMLPGSERLNHLVAWVKNYIGDELSWELNLVLDRMEVSKTRLGESGRLGWTVWLGAKRFEKDVDNVVLRNLAR